MTELNAHEREIVAAVDWWKQVLLRQPFKDAGSRGDESMQFAEVAGWLLSLKNAPDAEAVERFGVLLHDWLAANWCKWQILDCDYHPGHPLGELAKQAGVSDLAFPWKTTMWVREGHVSVRHGYGADEQVLYSAEEVPA
jgi:hypothetical protein